MAGPRPNHLAFVLFLGVATYALLSCAVSASSSAPTKVSHEPWKQTPSFHLRVLMHRTGSVVDPHDTCVIIRAAYGQPHRGLTESQRVIFQTYAPT